jgi:hypothetical protein
MPGFAHIQILWLNGEGLKVTEIADGIKHIAG